MKKKSAAIILSALAVVLVLCAACGKKDNKPAVTEPATVTNANGEVYEQVTEIVTEVETVTKADGTPEIKTEVVTEVVTNAKGEKVTKKDGTPEVVTEIVSEVVTEIVTKVETVTVPYTPPETTKKGETAAATTPEESEMAEFNTELLGGGTPVEVPTNKDGKPTNSKLRALFDKAKKGQQLMMKLYVSSQDMSDMGTMAYTFYTKGDKIAIDMSVPAVASLGALGSLGSMRAIINGNQATINFGKAYHFTTTLDDAEDMGMGTEIFDAIAAEDMDYQGTARVKDGGKTYDCETYTDDGVTNKYYFDTSGKLVRVEIITDDGMSTVMKVVNYSFTVSDKEFEPVGKAVSEEDLEKMFGSLT